MIVYIMRGIPGSGKSTYIKTRTNDKTKEVVCSADHYFETQGKYQFDSKLLGKAHDFCKKQFLVSIERPEGVVFVDNTNTTVKEMEFYVSKCEAANIPFIIVNVHCDVEKAAARNSHNVPADKVRQMHARMVANDSKIPFDWQQEYYYSE